MGVIAYVFRFNIIIMLLGVVKDPELNVYLRLTSEPIHRNYLSVPL